MSQSSHSFIKTALVIGVSLAATGALAHLNAQSLTIATDAGNGIPAYAGDGGPATGASINLPKGLAFDAAGNMYIADSANYRVRKVSGGVITTFAGNGNNAFSGDGGSATNASFSDVQAVVADSAGNIYIADSDNRRIRKVTTDGTVTTIAGVGVQGFSGDGGPATQAMLGRPEALAIDSAGNLYIADSVDQRIRKIDTGGAISTVAGNGIAGFSGDGGQAINASFNFPIGIAVDHNGNIYVADGNNNRIREITTAGIITTFAGNGTATAASAAGDGGPAVNASLNVPSDVAVDLSGNVYIADGAHNEVRMVNPSGIITTLAGDGNNGYAGDGGIGTQAQLNLPYGLAVDPSGNVYISDRANARVRVLNSGVTLAAPTLAAIPVVNGASFAQNAQIAPGAIVSIFGTNLAATAVSASTVPLGDSLGGATVTFNGIEAPLFYVSPTQINAQVPYNVPYGNVTVQVNRGGSMSQTESTGVTLYSPGIFVINQSTQGGAILHATTYGVVSGSSPAKPGELIAIYATGLGALNPPVAAGNPAPSSGTLPQTTTLPSVTIGGQTAIVSFSGLAPGFAGLYQINATVPAGVGAGNQSIQVSIGGFTSNIATIAIQ